MENTIDLRRLMSLLRQHVWGIVITTVACAVVALLLAMFVIPARYQATTQILVNERHANNMQINNTQQADVQMVNTYKDIITNPVILNEASRNLRNPRTMVRPAKKAVYRRDSLGRRHLVRAAKPAVYKNNGQSYKVSADELQDHLKVSTQQNSQVFSLTATTGDPEESAAIANAVAGVFKRKIKTMMTINNVTIVSRASAPKGKSFPSNKLFFLGGAILGLIISIAWIIIRDMLNTTVRDVDFLTNDLNLSNLGQISHFEMSAEHSYQNEQPEERTRENNPYRRI